MGHAHLGLHQPKAGIIILCRYDSTRLPGKVLLKIAGKEVLGYIYERALKVMGPENVVVATSTEKDDQPIVDYCAARKINCFRGSKDNVAQRFLQCGQKFNFDYLVRVCGDSVLLDHALLAKMIKIALEGQYDLVSNVQKRTFPPGMSLEIVKRGFYERAIGHMTSKEDKEHVTSYLYKNEGPERYFFVYNDECPEMKNAQLALDDASDLDFLTKIIKAMRKDHREYLLKDIHQLI